MTKNAKSSSHTKSHPSTSGTDTQTSGTAISAQRTGAKFPKHQRKQGLPATPEKISASINACSADSAGSESATHKQNGEFAPGHPWRWKPGTSGNPNGRPRRPKQTPLSDVLRKRLAQPFPPAPEKSYADIIGERIFKEALSGNLRAIQELFNRIEGRADRASYVESPDQFESEDWRRLRSAVCQALEPFPEAQAAAIQAIDENKTNANND